MENKTNEANSTNAMNVKDFLDILFELEDRARTEGTRFNTPAFLGYVYQAAAGNAADPNVLEILKVDSFDHSKITQKDLDTFIQHSKELVDFVLTGRRYSTRYAATMSDELAELIMHNFMHISDKSTVYLPFAGIASIADQCPDASYVGEELDDEIWALAQVRAFFYMNNVRLNLGNSLYAGEKYDTIVAMPPFGMKGEMSISSIVESLYNRLNDGGQMAVVVPASFLQDTGAQAAKVKKMLLSQNALYRVVLLPSEMLVNTAISIAVLLIQRGSEDCSITLTDYTPFVRDNRPWGTIRKLDMEAIDNAEKTALLSTLDAAEQKQAFQIRLDMRDLVVEGIWDINPKYHLNRAKIANEQAKGVKYVPLADLVELYAKANLVGGGVKVSVIRIQDLADSILNGTKDFLDLEGDEPKYKNLPLLMEDNLLLVALVGKTLKPTIFKLTDGHQIAYSENIVPLQLKSNLVSLEYLQCELASDFVLDQLEASHVGSVRPFINRANLKKILIRVPDRKEEQKRIIKERKDALSAELIQKLGLENEELRNTRYNEFVREMRVRKHAIGQVLNELDPAIDTLLRFEKKNNGVLRGSDIISERFGYSVDDYLQSIRFLTTKVMKMVNTLTNEYVPKGAIEEYNVVQLLEEYFHKHTIPEGYEVSIKHEAFTSDLHVPAGVLLPDGSVTEQLDVNAGDNMDFWTIEVCKEDFFQVLDNIISNAKRYGFTENRPDYCIRIEMEDVRNEKQPMVAIHIMNNGNPLPEGIQPEQVFAYGEGSAQGTGIGGWQIKQIVEGMGGKVELRPLNPEESNYTIDYVLTFPDKSVLVLDDKE